MVCSSDFGQGVHDGLLVFRRDREGVDEGDNVPALLNLVSVCISNFGSLL